MSTPLTQNTQRIRELIQQIENLPNAGSGGVELPSLTNRGAAEHLLQDKELINEAGVKVVGTMPNNGEVSRTMDGVNTKSVSIPAGYTSGGTVSLDDTIDNAVSDALAALTEKGVTVPAGTKVDGLADLIAAIEAGGGISGYDVACGMFVPTEDIAQPVVDTGWGEAPDLTKRVGVACIGFQPADTPNAYRNLAFVEALNANINQSVNSYRAYAYMSNTATSPSNGSNKNFAQGVNSCKYNSDGTIQLCGYTNSWKFAAGHIYIWFAVKEQ